MTTTMRGMRRACLALFLCVLALGTKAADGPLLVKVDANIYVVQGTSVSGQQGAGALNDVTKRKASLAARVLDQEILNSDYNRQLYDTGNRARVFADDNSDIQMEPWAKPLAADDTAQSLEAAKQAFAAWAGSLARDPKALALAVARRDYRDGIAAYRENAAIYRRVTRQKEILSYDDAHRFLVNEMATIRLVSAKTVETRLNGPASSSDIVLPDQTGASRLAQRMQSEVIGHISGIKSTDDLVRVNNALSRIAIAEVPVLKTHRAGIVPAEIRLTVPGAPAKGSPVVPSGSGPPAPRPAATTVAISVKIPPSQINRPVDITGGILPPPYPLKRAPAAGAPAPARGGAAAAAPAATGNRGNAGAAAASNGPAAGGGTVVGAADPTAPAAGAVDASAAGNGLVTPPSKPEADPGSDEGLKTFSSKGYHSADGMVFNPRNGLWQDPNDPSNTRIPPVITCCDDTGLAFPDEAIEAQQTYWWGDGSGGGTDPNCGRLYTCGPAKTDPGPDPGPTAGATGHDAEILKAIDNLNQNTSPEQRGPVFTNFLNSLPPDLRNRAIELLRQYNTTHGAQAAQPMMRGSAPRLAGGYRAQPFGRAVANNSTITGNGLSSHYEPVTPSAARDIVGRYKSIPGGVTLEGTALELPPIMKVIYVREDNVFIINDDLVYVCPVSAKDYAEIAAALAADDKLGVSLGDTQIVYGALPPHGTIALDLKVADRLLGSLVFGGSPNVVGYRPAPGYVSEPGASGRVAVYFNFRDFRFTKDDSGEIRRAGASLNTTLVPLSHTQGSNGGLLPDMDMVARGKVPPRYVRNLQHIQDNIGYYAREKIVRMTMAYGEAAAFARSLKAGGIAVNVQ